MYSLVQTSARQREILEILFRHGWDYMRWLLGGEKKASKGTGKGGGKGGKPVEPELPTPAILRNILTDLGPVYVKLGQLLSTRPDLLPPDYIQALSRLQTQVPFVAWERVEQLIRQELARPLDHVFAHIDPQAIAAGSIAQTHRAVLKNGQVIALKVQRPELESVVHQDIALLKAIAELMSGTNFGQYYDVVSLADEFGRALQAELDFTQEAAYTERLRQNLAAGRWFDPQTLIVPTVHWEATTKKLLALDWIDGQPLLAANLHSATLESSAHRTSPSDREAITTLLFRAFFQQFFVDGFFHADPHPGNLFYLADGRVAILDCGMMGSLDPRTQSTLTELVLAIANGDAPRCTQLAMQLATPIRPVNIVQLESAFDQLLRRYYNLNLTQVNTSQAIYEILQAGRENHLRWPGSIGLFAKALANLEGVGRQFNPNLNVFKEVRPLMADLIRHQLVGDDLVQTLLRTGLEFRNLSLESPRQFGFLLNRLSTETLKWNVNLSNLETLSQSLNESANRLSFSIVVGALIIGAAIVVSSSQKAQVYWISTTLFSVASLLGLWLIISILRTGRFR